MAANAGTAYIRIEPDFTRFNEELRVKLAKPVRQQIHSEMDRGSLDRAEATLREKTRPVTQHVEVKLKGEQALAGALTRVGEKAKAGAAGIAATIASIAGFEALKGAAEGVTQLFEGAQALHNVAGLTLDSATKLTAAANATGVPTKQLGLAIKTVSAQYESAESGGKKALGVFKDLGISQKDLAKTHGDTAKVFDLVVEGLGKMTPGVAKTADAAKLLGRNWIGLNPLLAHGGEEMKSLEKFAGSLGVTLNTNTAKNLETVRDAQYKWHIVVQAAQLFIINKLVPALIDIGHWISQNVVPAIKDAAHWTEQNLVPAFRDVARWIVQNVVPAVKDVAHWVSTSLIPAFRDVANWINRNVIPAFQSIADYIQHNVFPIIRSFGTVFKGVVTVIKGVINVIRGLLTGDMTKIWDGVKKIFSGGVKAIAGLLRAAFGELKVAAGLAFKGIALAATAVWGVVKTAVSGLLNAVVGFIETWVDNFFGSGVKLIKGLAKGIGSIGSTVIDAAKGLLNGAIKALEGFWNDFVDIGKFLIHGILNGIKDVGNDLKNGAVGIVKDAWHGIKDFFGIGSPSRLMHDMGVQIMQGLANGLGQPALISTSLSKSLTGPFDTAERRMAATVKTMAADVRAAFTQMVKDIQWSTKTSGTSLTVMGGNFNTLATTVQTALAKIASMTNKVLGALGAKPVNFSLTTGKQRGGRVDHFGGGWLGGRGLVSGEDDILISAFDTAALGEAVVTRHQAPAIEAGMQIARMATGGAYPYSSLDEVFGAITRPHGHQTGGRMRRHQGGGPNFDGHPTNVTPGIRNLIATMQQHFPLLVTATTDGTHVAGSDHYSGHAVDLAADSGTMFKAAAWIMSTGLFHSLKQGIHNPNLSINLGAVVPSSFWGASTWAGHANHLHLALSGALGPAVQATVKRLLWHGGPAAMRAIGQGSSDKTVTAANSYISSHMPTMTGDVGIPSGLGGSVPRQMFQAGTSLGYNKVAIAGLIGNAYQESSLNPGISGGGAAGLFQWTPPDRLFAYAAAHHAPWQDVGTQMGAMTSEFGRANVGRLNASGSPAAAATYFMNVFERPGIPALSNRINAANAAFAQGYQRGGRLRGHQGGGTLHKGITIPGGFPKIARKLPHPPHRPRIGHKPIKLPGDLHDISATYDSLRHLLDVDVPTVEEIVQYRSQPWDAEQLTYVITPPVLPDGSQPASYIDQDPPQGPAYAALASVHAVNHRLGELAQLGEWYGSITKYLNSALRLTKNLLPRFTVAIDTRKKLIARLQQEIRENLRKIKELLQRIKDIAKPPLPKDAKAKAAEVARRKKETDEINKQIKTLKDENQKLGGDRDTIGTTGQIGVLTNDIGAIQTDQDATTQDQITVQGLSGIGGKLGDASWLQTQLRSQIAELSPSALATLLAQAPAATTATAAADAGASGSAATDNSALLALLQQQLAQTGQALAVSQAQYAVLARLPSMGDGGVVPGPLGAPRMIIAHGGEEYLGVNGGGRQPVHVTVVVQDGAVDRNKIQVIATDVVNNVTRSNVRAATRGLPSRGGGLVGV